MDFSRDAFIEWGRQGGKKGGSKGGRRRMAKLTSEQRRRLARKAVRTRWRRKRTAPESSPPHWRGGMFAILTNRKQPFGDGPARETLLLWA